MALGRSAQAGTLVMENFHGHQRDARELQLSASDMVYSGQPTNTNHMNTAAHTLVSASLAIALSLFTMASAAIAGLAATATITGLSLFVALGLIEIMVLSYAAPAQARGRPHHARSMAPDRAGLLPFSAPSVERKAA